MISLGACAKGGSDRPGWACPPVVEYSRTEQAKVADETLALPDGAMIIEWLSDFAIMREQARACSAHFR